MFKKDPQECLASTVGVSRDLLFPAPSPSSAMKNPENTEDDPDPAKKVSKWNTPLTT
jgi:hypothetical protein